MNATEMSSVRFNGDVDSLLASMGLVSELEMAV